MYRYLGTDSDGHRHVYDEARGVVHIIHDEGVVEMDVSCVADGTLDSYRRLIESAYGW